MTGIEVAGISLEAHSSNCLLLENDNIQRQISVHIFAPNGGYCLSIHLYITELSTDESFSATNSTSLVPYSISGSYFLCNRQNATQTT